MNTNINNFTNQKNLQLLWDVLLDEFNIQSHQTTLKANIQTVFNSNINHFISRVSPKTNLTEMNKLFLGQVLLAVKHLSPQMTQDDKFKRITITDEVVSSVNLEPYTIEDIHAGRQSDFEKELNKKKMDLDTYLNTPKPKDIIFSDKNVEEKITEMEILVADKLAERNLELEILQKTNYNTVDNDKWLASTETSIKESKKHNVEVVSQKKVSWDDLDSNVNITNIFQKLKKTNNVNANNIDTNNVDDNITLEIEELTSKKSYLQQPSMVLPDPPSQPTLPQSAVTNVVNPNFPLMTQSQFIKQLNDMNTKLDNLYNIVSKLTETLQPNDSNKESKNEE